MKEFLASIKTFFRKALDGILSLMGKDIPKDELISTRLRVLFGSASNLIIATLCIFAILGTLFLGNSVVLVKALIAAVITFVGLSVIIFQLPLEKQQKVLGWISRNRLKIDMTATACGVYLVFFSNLGVTVGFIWAYTLLIISLYLILIQKYEKHILRPVLEESHNVVVEGA